jgi:ABC-type transport system involved in multi-copper enzyme maturation permease subunit
MTTTPVAVGKAPQRHTLDLSNTSKVPLGRLVKVEMRKMVDTRAGLWLIVAIVAITALITVIVFFAGSDSDHTFIGYMGGTAGPQAFLLPVLGILLVTQEWGQRTGMVTFTLEPHRGKVIAAKVLAALLFGLIAVAIAVVVAALATTLSGDPAAWDNIGLDDFGKFALLQVTGVLQGLAFGLIFLNSAAAIVTYFVLPIAFSIVTSVWSALRDIAPWVDLATSQQPLFSAQHLSGEQWGQLVTGTLIWVVLPFLAGLIRVLRAEVK